MVFIKQQQDDSDPAPALTRGLDILQILEEQGACSLEFLTQETGWPKSSIARLMTSMENYGAVIRDPSSKAYQSLYRLVPTTAEETVLRELFRERLQELAEMSQLSTEFYLFENSKLLLKEIFEPTNPVIRINYQPGAVYELQDVEAVALIVLTFGLQENNWPAGPLNCWEEGRQKKITGRRLMENVRLARQEEIAIDSEFNNVGIRRFAAPVFSSKHNLACVISLAQTWTPYAYKDMQNISQCLKNCSLELSEILAKRGL
ncbi:MAG: helix-turn-helix domain-containing protein [Verrucomicrobiota bacterium]